MKQHNLLVTLHPDEENYKKMCSYYKKYEKENTGQYINLFAACDGVTISIYNKNKKGKYSVVFQGPNAYDEALKWDSAEASAQKAKQTHLNFQESNSKISRESKMPHINANDVDTSNAYPQIGSDEVGTGDFCGPVIVVAAYVPFEKLDLIEQLGVTDSKKMTDDYICEIGPRLINEFEYSALTLMPDKYNEVHKTNNMNEIKAKMHNQALYNLSKKFGKPQAYVDQFCQPYTYFRYVKNEPHVVRNIVFATKGESKFPSVALASVIARYAFLRKMEAMGNEIGIKLPFGAGKDVDKFIKQYMKNHSEEELSKIAKLHWNNYQKYLENN